MKKVSLVAAALIAALSLSACQTSQMGTKQTIGTLGGAALGGLAGSQIGGGKGKLVATGAGVLLGAFIGNEIGASLDRADQIAAQQAWQQATAAPVGETIRWNNPQSGNSGTVHVVRDGYAQSGAYCREFQQVITVGGKVEQGYGTACMQPDGSWKIAQ